MINQTALPIYSKPYLSAGLTPTDVSFGSLQDPIEGKLGWTQVDMHLVDMTAAVCPMLWFTLTLLTDDLMMWTKCLVSASFLFVLKGALAFMTVIPDSIGWQNCKDRLTAEGMASM